MKQPSRNVIWKHNSFLGGVSMAKATANRILNASTSTDTSRAQAQDLLAICEALNVSLRTRKDQQ